MISDELDRRIRECLVRTMLECNKLCIFSAIKISLWHKGKRVLSVSEYYRTFQDMRRAVSLYYRTVGFNLDLLKFASRKYEALCKNF